MKLNNNEPVRLRQIAHVPAHLVGTDLHKDFLRDEMDTKNVEVKLFAMDFIDHGEEGVAGNYGINVRNVEDGFEVCYLHVHNKEGEYYAEYEMCNMVIQNQEELIQTKGLQVVH